jgi:lipopolysaccharide biosynthesis glycosyltransferase
MEEGVNLPVKWKKIFIKLKKNYDITTKSFNTGVFVFSTDIIKNNSFSKLKKLFLDYYPLAKYYDQPILNLFFYKKWKELPIQYNIEPVFSWRLKHKISPKKIRAIIWHFVGSNNKPWEKNHPFYRYWKESLSKADMINVKKFPNNIISYTPLNIFIHDKVLRLIRISDPREIRSITGHFMYRLLEMKKQLFKQL